MCFINIFHTLQFGTFLKIKNNNTLTTHLYFYLPNTLTTFFLYFTPLGGNLLQNDFIELTRISQKFTSLN